MKILITTGIFEPESGGPATYTPKIASKLVEKGHKVKVITLSNEESFDFDKDYNFDLQRVGKEGKFKTLFKLHDIFKNEVSNYDLAYSLDWFTVGIPLSMACKKKNVPYILRIGGGYIWEKYLRDGKEPMPLKDFYKKKLYLMPKYFVMRKLMTKVLRNASHIIFNTKIQPEFYVPAFKLKSEKVSTIFNPVPKGIKGIQRTEVGNEIVFAGRMIAMKNLGNLIRGYAKSNLDNKLILFGKGPQENDARELVKELNISNKVEFKPQMRQEDLYERIKNSRLVVISSWTDISPNQVFECMSLKIPFLLTKENYLPIRDQLPIMIDPVSPDDIAEKLKYLNDEENYKKYVESLEKIEFNYTWDDAAKEHEDLFKKILAID